MKSTCQALKNIILYHFYVRIFDWFYSKITKILRNNFMWINYNIIYVARVFKRKTNINLAPFNRLLKLQKILIKYYIDKCKNHKLIIMNILNSKNCPSTKLYIMLFFSWLLLRIINRKFRYLYQKFNIKIIIYSY